MVYSPSHSLFFCSLIDCSPPGSSVHGISQARILESVAISFSRGSSQPNAVSPALVGRFFTAELSGKQNNMQTLINIYGINNKVLLYHTGNYIQYPVINHNRKEYEKECIYMYIYVYN